MKRAWVPVIVLVLGCAAPAAAQRAVTVRLSGVGDGAVVQGTVPLKGEASASTGVRRLTISIDGDIVAQVTPSALRQNAETTFDWDSTQYVTSSALSRNRTYDVTVKGSAQGGGEDQVTATVVVDNPPVAPTGLTGSAKGDMVSLTWDANPEPDILGYRVERFYGNDYVKAAFVTEPAFSQRRDPGRYSYRVVAVRNSEVDAKGIASIPSAVATLAVAPAARGGTTGGSSGTNGSSKGKSGGRVQHAVTRRIGAGGLPGAAALPSSPGMSGLPQVPESTFEWGSYEKRLPYKLPKGGIPVAAAPARNFVTETLRVIPPDGLRWVAAGLLLLVTAGLARLLALRLQTPPGAAKIEA